MGSGRRNDGQAGQALQYYILCMACGVCLGTNTTKLYAELCTQLLLTLSPPPCPTLWSIARHRFLFLSAFSNYAPDYFLLSPASPLHCVEHGGVIARLHCFPAAPVLFSIVSSHSSALSATSNYAPNYFLLPSLPTLPCSTLE